MRKHRPRTRFRGIERSPIGICPKRFAYRVFLEPRPVVFRGSRPPRGGSEEPARRAHPTTTCGGAPDRIRGRRLAAAATGELRMERGRSGARGLVSRILYRAGSPCGGPAGGSHFSGTGVAAGLERPTREAEGADPRRGSLPYLAFLQVGFTEPPPSPEALVRSYRTVSPLPPGALARSGVGGLLSAALSLASRPVAVSNHPDPWSPDFPPRGRPKTPRSDCPGLSHRAPSYRRGSRSR